MRREKDANMDVWNVKGSDLKRLLYMIRKALSLSLLLISTGVMAETCPDFTQHTECVGLSQGSVCQGWYIQQGTVTSSSTFYQILSRSAFPFTANCQYDNGRLSLVQLAQAAPVAPYLWSTRSLGGLLFNVCVSSLQSCSFTLIG